MFRNCGCNRCCEDNCGCGNELFGGGNCCWIILIIILLVCCCGGC